MNINMYRIIDFNSEILPNISNSIINSLYDQDIKNISYTSRYFNQIFINETIIFLIKHYLDNNKIIYIPFKNTNDILSHEYSWDENWKNKFKNNIVKISKNLPILINTNYFEYENLESLKEDHINLDNEIDLYIQNYKNKISLMTFKKIRNFCNYYDLNFINNKLLNELKYKII